MMVRFTRKKIDTLTLGERMLKLRNERRLSLADISKSTKIQAKYLDFLESGEYFKLPADVYVKGFLKSYANFMGLNESSLIKQYLREKGIHKNIKKDCIEEKSGKFVNCSNFVVTPKIIIVALVVVFTLGCFWYLYSEVNSFVSTPRLFIAKPLNGTTVEGKSVYVAGVAEKDAYVFINDQPVLANDKGEFGEEVGLQDGLNNIVVRARNRFDKESVESVSVNAHLENQPEVPDNFEMESKNEGEPFKLEVRINSNPTWISVEADGNLVYSGILQPQSVQTFEAKEKISIASAKGNDTFVIVNGKDLGKLSDNSSPVSDVIFTAKGKNTSEEKN